MKDVGYQYVNIDDLWQGERDTQEKTQAVPARFPSGIKTLAGYGLKLRTYSDAGAKTYDGRPGSRDHQLQEAKTRPNHLSRIQ
jgi:alpha-galactosidase